MKSIFKSTVVAILTFEAKILLQRTKPKIIAVTGSVGKTSTKDAIYHAVKNKIRSRKSEKSYNSEIGVPLSILGLENAWSNPVLWLKNIIDGLFTVLWPGQYPELLVLEMGVDRPGDMKRLTSWLKPDVVVLTRLPDVPVHVEYFNSPEAVVAEKLILVEALGPDGVLVYNHDDQKILEAASQVLQRTIGYGRYSETDFEARGDQIVTKQDKPSGIEFTISGPKGEAVFSIKGAIGVAQVYNFAAAAAVGDIFDIKITEVAEALREFTPPPGRMRLIPGIKDTLIIDDTYNSSPVAGERALSTLHETAGFKRRVAVLGDMLELGRFSTAEHEKLGQQAAECADLLITVGVRSRGIAEGALGAGMSEKNILQYEYSDMAAREIQNILEPGDLVLIKGSQSMRMERIVEEIMANPNEAPAMLVRQSEVWRSKG